MVGKCGEEATKDLGFVGVCEGWKHKTKRKNCKGLPSDRQREGNMVTEQTIFLVTVSPAFLFMFFNPSVEYLHLLDLIHARLF